MGRTQIIVNMLNKDLINNALVLIEPAGGMLFDHGDQNSPYSSPIKNNPKDN